MKSKTKLIGKEQKADIKKHQEEVSARNIILGALIDSGSFYTGDIDNVVDELEGYNITREKIQEVFDKF